MLRTATCWSCRVARCRPDSLVCTEAQSFRHCLRSRRVMTCRRRSVSRGGVMTNEAFLQARDLLLRHREDYTAAVQSFRWPQPTEFNWALDWFDAHLATGERGARTALKIVG